MNFVRPFVKPFGNVGLVPRLLTKSKWFHADSITRLKNWEVASSAVMVFCLPLLVRTKVYRAVQDRCTGFLGLSRDCVVDSRVLVLLPKNLCAGLLSTPCVGTFLMFSKAKY